MSGTLSHRRGERIEGLRSLVVRMRTTREAIVESESIIRSMQSLDPSDAGAVAGIQIAGLVEDARARLPLYILQRDEALRRLGVETALAAMEYPGDAEVRQVIRMAEAAATEAECD